MPVLPLCAQGAELSECHPAIGNKANPLEL